MMKFKVGDKVVLRSNPDYVYIIDEITPDRQWVYFTKSRLSAGRGHDSMRNIKKVVEIGEQLTFDW